MTAGKSVLVADDDVHMVRTLAIRLKRLGLSVDTAANGLVAMVKILKQRPDLLIVDVGMPGADGLRVCERLSDKEVPAMPVIVLTGSSEDSVLRRCSELGAHYVHKGATPWEDLQPIVCALLGIEAPAASTRTPLDTGEAPPELPASAPRVLVVDDDVRVTQAVALRLKRLGINVSTARNGVEGYWVALKELPDVIISDYFMPDGGADYFLGRLRATAATRDIPLIILTGRTWTGEKDFALEREMRGRSGVVAYLTKPIDFDALVGELHRHLPVPLLAQAT
jgi:CheY-like chemotaxis protein